MGKTCTNCGKQIPDGAAFCTFCGTKAPADAPAVPSSPAPEKTPILCPKCGHTLTVGSAFCTECGQPIGKKSAAPAPFDGKAPSAETIPAAAAAVLSREEPQNPAAPRSGMQQSVPQQSAPQQSFAAQTAPQTQGTYSAGQPGQGSSGAQTPYPPYAAAAPASVSPEVGTGAYFGLMFLFAIPVLGWIVCLICAFAMKNKNIRNFARAQLIWMVIGLIFSGILFLVGKFALGKIAEGFSEEYQISVPSDDFYDPDADLDDILGSLFGGR